MLPLVKPEVWDGIKHSSNDEEFFLRALKIIEQDNPVIYGYLVNATDALTEAGMDGRTVELYLRGHIRMYMFLHAQDEANELAKQWGEMEDG